MAVGALTSGAVDAVVVRGVPIGHVHQRQAQDGRVCEPHLDEGRGVGHRHHHCRLEYLFVVPSVYRRSVIFWDADEHGMTRRVFRVIPCFAFSPDEGTRIVSHRPSSIIDNPQ